MGNVRPLSNKELYDYSPKFKEIQDTRMKQYRQQRNRMLMRKYNHAKKMYAEYPPEYAHKSRGYPAGHPGPEYAGRGPPPAAHHGGMEYRKTRERGPPPSEYDVHHYNEMMSRGRRI